MNFHNVKSINVERDLENGWTTIRVTRHERLDLDLEDERKIASEFGINKWDMPTVRRRLNELGTVTDEITFFHVAEKDIGITVETKG
jgi:hypothetical protein|tara:strand:+ start:242 stop:502 length:261 start_codon:yes stop_codon:yes gene_type:complete